MLAQVSQIKRKALIHDIERIADLSKCFTEQRYLLLAWDQEVPRGLCFFCHVPVILGRSNVRSVANLPVSLATLIVADDLGSGMKQTWLCLSLVFCVSFLMTPCFAWSDAVILVSKSGKLILNGPITRVRDKTIEIDTKYGVLTVNRDTVDCLGRACPSDRQTHITLGATQYVIDAYLGPQITAFARQQGFTVHQFLNGSEIDFLLTSLASKAQVIVTVKVLDYDAALQGVYSEELDIAFVAKHPNAPDLEMLSRREFGAVSSSVTLKTLAKDALVFVSTSDEQKVKVHLNDIPNLLSAKTDGKGHALSSLYPNAVVQDVLEGLFDRSFDLSDEIERSGSAEAALKTSKTQNAMMSLLPVSQVREGNPIILETRCSRDLVHNDFSILTGDYPLSYGIHALFYSGRSSSIGQAILSFLMSRQGDLVSKRLGFVTHDQSPVSLQTQGERLSFAVSTKNPEIRLSHLREMAVRLARLKRLSRSFRFAAGSEIMHPQSLGDFNHFVDEIRAGRYKGKTLYFVGFSDAAGSFDRNVSTSQKRALHIMEKIRTEVGPSETQFDTIGLGEVSPVACEASPAGPFRNRRVEVWIDDGA